MVRIPAVFKILALCVPLSAQTLVLDTPTEVERARAKADKAWHAWQAHGDIETRIFQLPTDRALAEIKRDGALADAYLAARQQQVTLLGSMFRRHAEDLASTTTARPDLGKLRQTEEQNLTELLEGRLRLREATATADQDHDPARQAARRQAVDREAEDYKKLEEDAHDRLELLGHSEQSQAEFDRNERALIDTLNHLADTLDTQAAAFGEERQKWEKYHEDLARLVAPGAEGSSDRSKGQAAPKKPAGPK